jgi:hypothetical protein
MRCHVNYFHPQVCYDECSLIRSYKSRIRDTTDYIICYMDICVFRMSSHRSSVCQVALVEDRGDQVRSVMEVFYQERLFAMCSNYAI